jgi:hypothetical protein
VLWHKIGKAVAHTVMVLHALPHPVPGLSLLLYGTRIQSVDGAAQGCKAFRSLRAAFTVAMALSLFLLGPGFEDC